MEQEKQWSHSKRCLFFAIILIGVIIRIWGIGERPLHHDESLHGMYGLYWFDNAISGHYKYDPMLHGPLLYFLYPFFYKIFGIDATAVRLPVLTLGILFLFVPFLFRRFFSVMQMILLTGLIAFSPYLTYYSRFVHHDPLVFFSMLVMLAGVVLVPPKYRIPVFGSGLALFYTVKANAYIVTVMLLAYLAYEAIVLRLSHRPERPWWRVVWDHGRVHPRSLIVGILLTGFFFCYLFSAEFRHLPGILDGLYRKSLPYWFNQHNHERISGPFSFHFILLSFYEGVFVLAFLIHLIAMVCKSRAPLRIALIIIDLSAIALVFLTPTLDLLGTPVAVALKLKIPIDFGLAFLLLTHSVIVPTWHIIRGERTLAFWGYFFYANAFTYAYAGEKTPWLALYPLVTGIIYFMFFFQEWLTPRRSVVVLAIASLYLIPMNIFSTHVRMGEMSELLSQVHTTRDFHQLMTDARNQIITRHQENTPRVLVVGDAIWPTTWYLRELNAFQFTAPTGKVDSFTLVVLDFPQAANVLVDPAAYTKRVMNFRGWFSPDYRHMSLLNFLNYAVSHRPWGPIGHSMVTVYEKRDAPLPTPPASHSR